MPLRCFCSVRHIRNLLAEQWCESWRCVTLHFHHPKKNLFYLQWWDSFGNCSKMSSEVFRHWEYSGVKHRSACWSWLLRPVRGQKLGLFSNLFSNLKIAVYRWVLRGSALIGRSLGAVWDLPVPQRRGDGLHQRAGPNPRAQGQTGDAREDLRWVGQSSSPSAPSALCSGCHFLLSFHLPLLCPVSLLQVSHVFLYLVPQWRLPVAFTLTGISRLLPLLIPDAPEQKHSWELIWREMFVMSSGQRPQPHTQTRQCLTVSVVLSKHHSCLLYFFPLEWLCFEKDPGRGQVSPASLRVPMNRWEGLLAYRRALISALLKH